MSSEKLTFLIAARSTCTDAMGEVLESLGYGYSAIKDLAEVVPILERGKVGGILVDSVQDEGTEALELVRAICLLAAHTQTPVIFVHSPDEYELMERAFVAGAMDAIARPLYEGMIEHRLRVCAAQTRMRRPSASSTSVKAAEHEQGLRDRGDREIESRETFSSSLEAATADATTTNPVALITVALSLSADATTSGSSEDLEDFLAEHVPSEMFRTIEGLERRGEPGFDPGSTHVTRLDKNRFALLLPHLSRIQVAAKLGVDIQAALSRPYLINGNPARRAVHVGIASCPQDAPSAEALLKASETACYCARQDGGDSLQFYTASMSRWAFERLTLERSLANAIEKQELEVFYQPRVDLNTRIPIGLEALVRWRHPELGLVSPAQFIPLAEETGLIIPIGRWVLEQACLQNKRWQDLGLPNVRMSVNLSAMQFRKSSLLDEIRGVLADTGLEADQLELEVTESMLMQDAKSTIETLRGIKSSGIHISIDDFGTGYSSLSYLKRFPVDALKIDRSFIREVNTNPDDAAIATSIILMGHSLRLGVVAEGVEEESQLAFLRVLQCDEAQGYLFSPPVPAQKAEDFLRSLTGAPRSAA